MRELIHLLGLLRRGCTRIMLGLLAKVPAIIRRCEARAFRIGIGPIVRTARATPSRCLFLVRDMAHLLNITLF